MKNGVVIACVLTLIVLCLPENLHAGPTKRYGGFTKTSLGVRLGWNGGPNGLTLRRVFAPGHAFEAVAGYNNKSGRHADEWPAHKKGNTFLGISYAPFLLTEQNNLGLAITGDIGTRLNYHHYRFFSHPEWGSKITADVYAGIGLQVEFSEAVEVFADLHIKYFSDPHNAFVPGMESGLGVRVVLN